LARSAAVQHENAAQQRIVAAARQLFASRGFHQTAMADLAREAKVSVGAIYRSYTSKADIVLAIIVADSEITLGQLQGDAERVRNGDISIETAIQQIVLRSMQDKDEALVHEILAEGHRNPAVASAVAKFCVQYREIFIELAKLARPSLSGEYLEGAGELLLACMFGIGHRRLSQPSIDEVTTARIVSKMILNALGE